MCHYPPLQLIQLIIVSVGRYSISQWWLSFTKIDPAERWEIIIFLFCWIAWLMLMIYCYCCPVCYFTSLQVVRRLALLLIFSRCRLDPKYILAWSAQQVHCQTCWKPYARRCGAVDAFAKLAHFLVFLLSQFTVQFISFGTNQASSSHLATWALAHNQFIWTTET